MLTICTKAPQPTHPQPFTESFYQCHLIQRKMRAPAVDRDFGFLKKGGLMTPLEKPKIKTYKFNTVLPY